MDCGDIDAIIQLFDEARTKTRIRAIGLRLQHEQLTEAESAQLREVYTDCLRALRIFKCAQLTVSAASPTPTKPSTD